MNQLPLGAFHDKQRILRVYSYSVPDGDQKETGARFSKINEGLFFYKGTFWFVIFMKHAGFNVYNI